MAVTTPVTSPRPRRESEKTKTRRREAATRAAAVFAALGEPNRLLAFLMIVDGVQVSNLELARTHPAGIAQPTISHHVRTLVQAGLVERHRAGKNRHYEATELGRWLATVGDHLIHGDAGGAGR